jgi:Protein of unknown function DUF262
MSTRDMSPPAPSVEHLTTIFRRIRQSDIRIPAFQREFVWDEGQVLELLESVYKGFPIGSLLMWRVEKEILKIAPTSVTGFPVQEDKYPASFVLDGLQRLSALFGVCHFGETTTDRRFNVIFNLRTGEFINAADGDKPAAYVPLSALFTPKAFMEVQRNLIEQPRGESLVEKAIDLHAIFQEYMLPIVTISHEEPDQVVQIFERVNTTGTRLSSVDFMRAITWSQNFDLNQEIDAITTPLRERNYELRDSTVVKALGMAFGLDPLPDVLLKLRSYTDTKLKRGLALVRDAFEKMIKFLADEFRINSSQFIPYEGQMLVLVGIFLKTNKLDRARRNRLAAWYRATSLNEALTGRPDHFVARTIRAVQTAVLEGGSVDGLRVGLVPEELMDRRFLRGKALSTAFVELLAAHSARSLVSGDIVEPNVFMSEFTQSQYLPVFSISEVRDALDQPITSSKVIANVVLIPEEEQVALQNRHALAAWFGDFLKSAPEYASVSLSSQFIEGPCLEALLQGNVREFLRLRAHAVIKFADELVQAGWP